jgi:hypothetical protein
MELTVLWTQLTVAGLFRHRPGGDPATMENSHNETRVTAEAPEERPADESQARQASTAALARMLANPRRTRRA